MAIHAASSMCTDFHWNFKFSLGGHSILRTNRAHGSMVQSFKVQGSIVTKAATYLHTMLFKYSHRHRFNFLLFLVWLIKWLGLWTILIVYFVLLRSSFRATNDFPSFPFSGTHYLIRTNAFRQRNMTGKLLLVCKLCWPISMVCAPCGGGEFFDSIGFELDILWTRRRKVAWWRHPFVYNFFSIVL